jgi:hypothetical protein
MVKMEPDWVLNSLKTPQPKLWEFEEWRTSAAPSQELPKNKFNRSETGNSLQKMKLEIPFKFENKLEPGFFRVWWYWNFDEFFPLIS